MRRLLLYIGVLWGASGCLSTEHKLQTGDLLFVAGENTPMTGAITAATGAEGALNFSHVGIAVVSGSVDSVLEASTQGGVKMTSLPEFLARAAQIGGRPAVVAMRLRDTTGTATAVARARTYIGQPYDYSYLPANGKLYCSELVWESYLASDSSRLFSARPMNFRAADGTMPAFWSELFAHQGESVPQGVPGTNPNDMARERQLKEVYRWF